MAVRDPSLTSLPRIVLSRTSLLRTVLSLMAALPISRPAVAVAEPGPTITSAVAATIPIAIAARVMGVLGKCTATCHSE